MLGAEILCHCKFSRGKSFFIESWFFPPDLMSLVCGGHASIARTTLGAQEAHSGLHGAGTEMWWPRTPPLRPLSQGYSMPCGSQQQFCLIFFWNKVKHSHNPHLFHKHSPAGWTSSHKSDQAAKHIPLFVSQSPKLDSQNPTEGQSEASCSFHPLQLGGGLTSELLIT